MKNLCLIFFGFFFLSLFSPAYLCFAAEQEYYAKVQTAGVQFYLMQNDNTSLFEVPTTYFVKIKPTDGDYFSSCYKNINGYVKKTDVTIMKGSPVVPYANATFKVFLQNYMYLNPTQSSSIVVELSTADVMTFYGTKSGQQVSSQTNVWYYSSVEKDGQLYFGYVFSGITDYLSSIPTNTETFEVINESQLSPSVKPEISTLSTKTKVLLIVSIALPSALILYFLIKPSHIMTTKTKRQIKKERKKTHHGDYFEFDESEL